MKNQKSSKNQPSIANISPSSAPSLVPVNYHLPWLSRLSLKVQCWILFLTGFLLYANTISNGYALDDLMVYTQNEHTKKGLAGIKALLTKDSFDGFTKGQKNTLPGGRYRPLSIITFAIEYELWKESPGITHGINALLYGVTIVIIFLLLRNFMFRSQADIAFWAALIFAFHPIHTEAIANIKSRDEILSLLFLLLSQYLLFTYLYKHKNYQNLLPFVEQKKSTDFSNTIPNSLFFIFSLLCLFLALLSKENGLTYLGIIPLTLYFFTRLPRNTILRITGSYLVVILIYLFIRTLASGANFQNSNIVLNNAYIYATKAQQIATNIVVLQKYVHLLFFPYPLTWDYTYKQIDYYSFATPEFLIAFLLHLLLLAYALKGLKTKNMASYAILYYLFSIFIVSGLVISIGGAFLAERFLYQGSLGFCIILALGIHWFSQRLNTSKIQAVGIAGLLLPPLLIMGYHTIHRNTIWKDSNTLFIHDADISDKSAMANKAGGSSWLQLGIDILKRSRKDSLEIARKYIAKGQGYLRKAIAIFPEYPEPYMDIGLSYFALENVDSAEYFWLQARKYAPNSPFIKQHNEMLSRALTDKAAKAYARKEVQLAIDILNRAVSYNPDNHSAWTQLAVYYIQQNNLEQALRCAQEALRILPTDPNYLYNVGAIYFKMGEKQKAIEAFETCLRVKPDHPAAPEMLAKAKLL
ncbi:MAG: tetratricopeptide repeat protein [Bacteroidia bacterium]|nr:tetratricopeptide repeat protein [Bacteroidia bacterium]MDW8158088.1 tetratricopeptide repeat protein [Bacteroidia bacterium]